MTDIIKAALLGIVEGLTEFLPVSSTGHLIIVSELLNYQGSEADTFNIFIQIGAILAVLVFFRERFILLLDPSPAGTGFRGIRGLGMLALTTLPALIFGKLFHDAIKTHLFSVSTVAIGLAVGAVWILLTERFHRHQSPKELDQITWGIALAVGLFQCLAMWPGMSRSACTILGALYLGMSRRAAAEFSFFAAVPLLFAAATYDLYSSWDLISVNALPVFATGLVAAFFSALVAVRFFVGFISRHTFSPFAWYRLGLAAVLIWWVA